MLQNQIIDSMKQSAEMLMQASRDHRSYHSPNYCLAQLNDIEFLIQPICENPRIAIVRNLLSHSECDMLIQASSPKLERSMVVNNDGGDNVIHEARTSSGTHFLRGENALIKSIEDRIALLTSIPSNHGESLQVLRYGLEQKYSPHYDYFDPNSSGGQEQLKRGGQRVATVLMYLNDVAKGGDTIFPKINLKVIPQKGMAVVFFNCKMTGNIDPYTLHGGEPVLDGEKWIMTKWIRASIHE